MNFTGKNLELVREAVELAIREVHNQIATCPNVYEFSEEIEDLEEQKAKLEKLLARMEVHVQKKVV